MKYKIRYIIFLLPFINLSFSSLLSNTIRGSQNIIKHSIKQYIEEPPDTIFVNEEYDFIIVGAGSAGSVLTRRLAENPNWNILLIEAGGRENFYTDIPITGAYSGFTSLTWQYNAIPSSDGRYCAGMENGECPYQVGKTVGGSSSVNFMFYTRGNRDNYDEWARLGNEGWSYDDLLPYFKKIENFNVPGNINMSYHGTDGPVYVGYSSKLSTIGEAFLNASQQFGLDYVDYNGEQQVGVSRTQANIKNGVRQSASRVYLHPIRNQKNFHLKKLSQVKKILINPETKEAYGVEYVNAGQTYQVKARKEVILSAGVLNSPKILMLSGIGPKDHLEDKNIRVIQDLPVGQSTIDHILANPIIYITNNDYGLDANVAEIENYIVNFTGTFSTTVTGEALIFLNTDNATNTNLVPNMELIIVSNSLHNKFNFLNSVGVPRKLFDELYSEISKNISFSFFILFLQPKSRGQILLRDNKYDSPPIIAPNYFGIEDDLETLAKGVRIAMEIAKQDAFKPYGTKIWDKKMKQCEQYSFYSDDYIKCAVEQMSFALRHMVGTCRMGPDNDTLAIVDQRLRVKGIKNLRVVDGSIMPHIPSGHTNVPCMMIGEKASDLIKEDYK